MWSRHIPDTLATRQQQHDPPSGTLHTPTNTHNSLTVTLSLLVSLYYSYTSFLFCVVS